MKVAFTGSSSTGKTTLVNALLAEPDWPEELRQFVTVDARKLLVARGYHSMDDMTPNQTREFQRAYFAQKLENERNVNSFLTDRSYVDVAAYWVVRDTAGLNSEIQNELTIPCQHEVKKYDLHVYFPFGLVPFASDGYRSTDIRFHSVIDEKIRAYLDDWKVEFRSLNTMVLSERVALVKDWVREIW